jgi:hypothetical protein
MTPRPAAPCCTCLRATNPLEYQSPQCDTRARAEGGAVCVLGGVLFVYVIEERRLSRRAFPLNPQVPRRKRVCFAVTRVIHRGLARLINAGGLLSPGAYDTPYRMSVRCSSSMRSPCGVSVRCSRVARAVFARCSRVVRIPRKPYANNGTRPSGDFIRKIRKTSTDIPRAIFIFQTASQSPE